MRRLRNGRYRDVCPLPPGLCRVAEIQIGNLTEQFQKKSHFVFSSVVSCAPDLTHLMDNFDLLGVDRVGSLLKSIW